MTTRRRLERRFWRWVGRKAAPHIPARYSLLIDHCFIDSDERLAEIVRKVTADHEATYVGFTGTQVRKSRYPHL